MVKSFMNEWKNILEKIIYDGVAVQCDLISQDGIKKSLICMVLNLIKNFIKSYSQF